MHRAAVAALVAVTVVAAAGCGRDRAQARMIDHDDPEAPCTLYSTKEIRSVVNIPPENNEINSALLTGARPPIFGLTGVKFCHYRDAVGALEAYVGVATLGRDAEKFARSSFEKWRRDAEGGGGATLQPVKGLGQQAVWRGGASSGSLVVLDGYRILTITLTGEQAPALERAKKLAAKGLPRI